MPSEVQIETPVSPVTGKRPFLPLHQITPDINLCILIGGRGGMKSYECSKFLIKKATIDGKRCAILRDEKSKIKNSILNEIKLRYDTANQYGHLDRYYEKQENAIKNRKTASDCVFTMGFKASSNQNTAGLKSVSDVDIAMIEEAEDIRDSNKFNSFADSIRKEGYLIIIVLNTPDLQHWITQRYFHAEKISFADVPELKGRVSEKELDGYFKLIPRERPGFLCIQTSYLDNPYMPEAKKRDYENYGNPSDTTYDLHYYLTAIKGFASSGRRGQIHKKIKPISLKEYMSIPVQEIYGQDFGTASPAGLIATKWWNKASYAREISYEPYDVKELGKLYCRLKFTARDRIIADNAEPDTIAKLKNGWLRKELTDEEIALYPNLLKGFFIEGCLGKTTIEEGISLMNATTMYAVTESVNLWNEINNRVYDTDKNGNPTDTPKPGFDHLLDPWMYILQKQKFTVSQNLNSFTGAFR